jgi:hypothetical protein
MFVAKNIENKKIIQSQFYEVLSKYIYKYINRILKMEYDLHKASKTIGSLYPNFQKRLLKISKWSDYHIDKEYVKFLKWADRKYNYSEQQMQQMLNDIITITIQVMIHKPSLYVEKLLTGSLPSLRSFYYKCLKRLCRIFYENPRSTKSITLSQLKDKIDTTINIVLPVNKINSVLEIQKREPVENESIKNITYDFNKLDVSDKSIEDKKDTNSTKSSSFISKDPILYYISSDNSQSDDQQYKKDHQQYNQEQRESQDPYNYSSTSSSENGVKEIYIPKKHKYYHKSKIDEINEYFFNE